MSLARTRPSESRKPDLRELPDGRKRLTRFFDLPLGSHLVDALIQPWGTADTGPATGPTAGFAGLRLVDQFLEGAGAPGLKPVWVEVYEELPATGEQLVGRPVKIRLEDGRDAWEYNYLQFAADTYVPGTVGTSTAPDDASLFLQREEAPDDGALRRIKRTYVAAGLLDQEDATQNNGKLLLRTLVYAKTLPPTPSGYVLVREGKRSVNGFPVYTYLFAKGDGEIGRVASTDQGGKLERVVITHLTASSVGTQPTSDPLSGGVAVVTGRRDEAGYRVWEITWGKGLGEVGRSTRYEQSDDTGTTGVTVIEITHLTALATGTDPTSSPGAGFVKVAEPYQDEAAHRVWRVTWAKGTGLIVDSVQIRSLGKLKVYHRVALAAAPSAPSATLGGTVTLFDTDLRKGPGYAIYDYRWAEAEPAGQVGISTSTRGDGSIVYTVTELGAASATPAYPGGGTGYLVDLDQNRSEGHYVNRATYIKPPATVTLKRPEVFDMPGTVTIESAVDGHNLLLSPPKSIPILADVEVSYGTAQLTDTHYFVEYGCFLNVAFIRSGQTLGESVQQAFSNYVSAGGTASGTTPDEWNGVVMESYDVNLEASDPTARPTGSTVIEPPINDIYLMAMDGTVVYRRIKKTYSF